MRIRLRGLALASIVIFSGCASRVLEYDHADEVLKNDEYESKVQVTAVGANPPAEPTPPAPAPEKASRHKKRKKKSKKIKEAVTKDVMIEKVPGPRQPEIEDTEGFVGRRPKQDPFRVGEKVTLNLTYFNITAGTMDIAVKPSVDVNKEKAYQFEVTAKSGSFFNHIYGVDDKAITYMSYEQMRPLNLQITLKESKQLAEARTFFDWKTLKANYWQKRVTKEHGEESKKLEWDIKDYSQNVISAAFYLRTFQMPVGKKLAMRVADEGKNIVFKGEVLRKEKLSTALGELDTIVLKPELTVDGVFTPVGEILVWLTDDDRKFIVRIESKIKIGTIIAKVKAIDKGGALP